MPSDRFDFRGLRAVLATMHAKEQVIGPILRDGLGLIVDVPRAFDTDRFGTFSREVARNGSQLDAARAKIEAVFDFQPSATIALASEGSFGPDPHVPIFPCGREIVVLKDRMSGLELVGFDASPETNFEHAIISNTEEADTFAKKIGFPGHGLIAMGCRNGEPAPDVALIKDISTLEKLRAAVDHIVGLSGLTFLETDMRGHRNPTRMRAIARASRDLVRRFSSRCPCCTQPGYGVTEYIAGLPCKWCEIPTPIVQFEVHSCNCCGHKDQRRATDRLAAEPGECPNCNP